jgi:hypothetical protein
MLTGCGNELIVTAAVPIEEIYPPSITAMQFSQDTVNKYVNGAVDFTAASADLDTMTIVVSDSMGQEVYWTVTDLRTFAGYVYGSLAFSIDYLALLPGQYIFTIYLTDRLGNLSNPVYGTVLVSPLLP